MGEKETRFLKFPDGSRDLHCHKGKKNDPDVIDSTHDTVVFTDTGGKGGCAITYDMARVIAPHLPPRAELEGVEDILADIAAEKERKRREAAGEKEKPATPSDDEPKSRPFDKMKKDELIAIAKVNNVFLDPKWVKAKIIAAIEGE